MFRKLPLILISSVVISTAAYADIGKVGSPNLVMAKPEAAPKPKPEAKTDSKAQKDKPVVTIRLNKNHVNVEGPLRRAITDRQNSTYTVVGFGPKSAGSMVRDAMNEAHQTMVQQLGINPDNITMRQEASTGDNTAELRVYKTKIEKARK